MIFIPVFYCTFDRCVFLFYCLQELLFNMFCLNNVCEVENENFLGRTLTFNFQIQGKICAKHDPYNLPTPISWNAPYVRIIIVSDLQLSWITFTVRSPLGWFQNFVLPGHKITVKDRKSVV